MPSWVVKIAETVHLYEAWLATLAIVFFHFFFVIYHPEQFPMSLTWLHGKMPMDQLEHHHPAWHKELVEKKANEQRAASETKEDDTKREMEIH
jgi:hypothetical protein